MAKGKAKTGVTPTRSEDYPEWYQQVIKVSELAENSPVRGCMVIKPWGYSLWENMQRVLDDKFKETGHRNAYFPLFIPVSYLEKEAKHVEGFAKECAVVTHSRLEAGPDGKLHPASPLEEPLIVRPTSETIIGEMYSKWVQSYRDLPILINQWANVVRWEMRTRLFLRTAEFLWQEGHTAHATQEEAWEETRQMLDVYADFARDYMAMPVIRGEKTEGERFPGAVSTLCIEAMMQDCKALQAGTSHFLGQNFAKASEIQFLNKEGEQEYAWTTSWGVSTRLVGGMVMAHSDDDGLVLPPRLAPSQLVILPVVPKEEVRGRVMEAATALRDQLREVQWQGRPLQVELDDRDLRGGEKNWQWIKRGIPLRVEIGPKDIDAASVFVSRRDTGEKKSYGMADFPAVVTEVLESVQAQLLQRAQDFQTSHTVKIDSKDDFIDFFTPRSAEKPEIHGGFALAHWAGTPEDEAQLQREHKVTIRCIPYEADVPAEPGTCPFTGKPSPRRLVFSKSY